MDYKKLSILSLCFIIFTFATIHLISFTENKTNIDFHQKYTEVMSMDINNLEKLASLFPKTVQEINDWTSRAIKIVHQEIAAILQEKNLTFETTMRAVDISFNKFSNTISMISMLSNVHPDTEMIDAALNAEKQLRDVEIDLSMNSELYHLIKNYYDNYSKDEKLSTADQLLITNYLKTCKRLGLHLPAQTLEQVKKLAKEISEMEQDFIAIINKDNTCIKVTADELAGVNDAFLSKLEKDGELYIVSCKLACYIPVIEECSAQETRKKIFLARNNIAYPENDSLLVELLKKRQELATLLGHTSFASLDLEQTSAKNIDTVEKFLTELADRCLQKTAQELNELRKDLPENLDSQKSGCFNLWDYPYIYRAYNKKHFSIDESKISEYFPIEKVIHGIFNIYQNFLGLTFKKVTPQWSWHEDVMLIEIYHRSSQELLGYLFLDLYPRANKYSHACVQPIIGSYDNSGKNNASVATLITNFPKPSKDSPALLKYDDVVTFFHEFGHAMHHVLGRTKHPGQAGINVLVDFIETPSQMFEEWMFEPEMLKIVSGHYKTGETLPIELIKNKILLRQSNSGYVTLRQCMIALFALRSMSNLNTSYNPSALWESLHKKYALTFLNYEENNHWYATFGHLASGLYASKYYSYLWTKVFALDLFATIKENNFNQESSQKVIDFLSAGGSIESEILLENFLGRKPNQDSFLKGLGLQ